jgi:hypothetical protein
LVDRQRDFFGATGFCENEPVALMDGNPTSQVRKGKCALAITSVRRSNELKQRLVLRDRQQLTSQNIQPAGAKFPAKILISPTYG